MQRNVELERVAEYSSRLDAGDHQPWWLDDPPTVTTGTARGEWLGDSFVRLQADLGGKPTWDFVIARNDARDEFVALYDDAWGVPPGLSGDARRARERCGGPTRTSTNGSSPRRARPHGRLMRTRPTIRGSRRRKDLDLIFERAR